MNTLEKSNNTLTRKQFIDSIKESKWKYTEYKKYFSKIYRIEYLDSFLKCCIEKTEIGVEIIYLDSHYAEQNHKYKLIGYATFVISYRINDNKGFNEIEFNNNGEILTIK